MAENRNFNQIIHDNQIDLKSKSLKSWIRTFNSKEKITKYGFELSDTERFTILKGLKDKQRQSKKRYSRRVR
ncbi:MAG: hypothetical protein U9P72_06965 [Campylobacterota bacterium]|nr:hypothetical protein [Campylobacterota bacterium]